MCSEQSFAIEKVFVHKSEERNHRKFPNESDFKEISNKVQIPYFDGLVWIKIKLNKREVREELFLNFSSPLSGTLTLFEKGEEGNWVEVAKTGSAFMWSQRDVKSYHGTFKLKSEYFENGDEILVKRDGHHLFDADIEVLTKEQFQKKEFESSAIFFFYYGSLISLILYNLFLYVYGKEQVYGIYVVFLASVALAAGTASGAMDRICDGWFVPSEYLLLFSSFATFMAAAFSRKFLDTEKYLPKWDRYFKWTPIIPMIPFTIYTFFQSSIEVRANLGFAIDIIIPIVMISCIVTSVLSLKSGSPLAKFYLLSWIVLLLGVSFYLLGLHGQLNHNILTQSGIMLGNIGEMLLLSMALAYRINYIQIENLEMKQKALDKERYQRLVRVLCHDISNPLSIITSYAARIVKKGSLDPEKQVIMAEKIQKASQIIEDLLLRVRNFESLDHSKNLNLLPVYLKHIMSEAEFILQEKLNEKNIKLDYNPNEVDCWVIAERSSLLNNVIINLLSNSIKFSKPNSSILLSVVKNGEKLTLSIKDHGVGMTNETIANFLNTGHIETRLGTSGEKGTGLGMSLMKSYMNLYQGEVVIKSTSVEIDKENSGTQIDLVFRASE